MKANCVDCGDEFRRPEDEPWKIRCYQCWVDRAGRRRVTKPMDPAELVWLRVNIKELLQLCHPDKHSNSPLSNRITQDLLELKRSA